MDNKTLCKSIYIYLPMNTEINHINPINMYIYKYIYHHQLTHLSWKVRAYWLVFTFNLTKAVPVSVVSPGPIVTYGSCVNGVFALLFWFAELLRESTIGGVPGSTASLGQAWKSAEEIL